MFEKSIFPEDLAGMEMRGAFGNALVIQGGKHENLVVIEAAPVFNEVINMDNVRRRASFFKGKLCLIIAVYSVSR